RLQDRCRVARNVNTTRGRPLLCGPRRPWSPSKPWAEGAAYNSALPSTVPGTILEAQHLAAQRGGVPLFKDIAFALNRGEALVVTGANGSGKTTLLRMVAGLTLPSAGT